MGFAEEREIKCTRKERRCDGCGQSIPVGSQAVRWAGTTDGEFAFATFHTDCRQAEIALNRMSGTDWDEWMGLDDMDDDDWPWLLSDFPEVAQRIGITQAKYEDLLAERAGIAEARRKIEDQRP